MVINKTKGQMKMVLCGTANKITITALGLRSLPAENSSNTPPNSIAYVKISLCPDEETRLRHRTTPQYVINDSVTLHENFAFDITDSDLSRRVLISAWCKNISADHTEFIGCMSFGVRGIVTSQEVVQGWFYFLRESLGRRKHLKVKSVTPASFTPAPVQPPRAETRAHTKQGSKQQDFHYSTLPTRGRHSARGKKPVAAELSATCLDRKVFPGCQCMYCKQGNEHCVPTTESKQKRRRSPHAGSHGLKRPKMPGDYDVIDDPLSRGGALRDANAGNANRTMLEHFEGSRAVGASPQLKACLELSPLELRCASVQRTVTRSARIVAPVARRNVLAAPAGGSDVSGAANGPQTPSPAEDNGYHSSEAEKENQEEVNCGSGSETAVKSERSNAFRFDPAAWDIAPTPKPVRRAGRLSLDAGLKALHELRGAEEGFPLGDDVIREEATEEKAKGKLSALMTWIQRKAETTSTNAKQEVANPKSSNFKRSSSLRRSKRESCENCFCSSSSLSQLLSRKGGISAFRTFLQSEFSDENLDFWLECESFKRIKGATKIHKVAAKIYNQFLVSDSPSEINVDSNTREDIKARLNDPSTDMFDHAQERIHRLMEQDSFRRFIVSDFAHKCKTHAS